MSFDPNKESTYDAVAYGDGNAISPGGVWGLGTTCDGTSVEGEWCFAQPAKPDPIAKHRGYVRRETTVRPPANGNFWFPVVYQDKLIVSHFVICNNNNHPAPPSLGGGCNTASQSIGVWDIVNRTYSRIDIPAKGSTAVPVEGSVSDIEVDQKTGRIYYLGRPNYIGYLDPQGSTWVPGRAHSLPDICGSEVPSAPDSCGVGNEMALLPTGDVVVTDRNLGKVRIFDAQLNPRTSFHTPDFDPKGHQFIFPLTVEGSPRCLATQGNGCVAARFAINFDVNPFTPNVPHPIQEYVVDHRIGRVYATSDRPVIPETIVWDDVAKNYKTLDGDFRAVKYDQEGTLWVSTYDRAQPYSPAEVFAFVPRLDPTGGGDDRYPWQGAEFPNPSCPRRRNPERYIVCRPSNPAPGDAQTKPIFPSSGRLVDSIAVIPTGTSWSSWGGSLDGVIRLNPGAFPPRWTQDGDWRPSSRIARNCDLQSAVPARPDAFVPVDCSQEFSRQFNKWRAVGSLRVPLSIVENFCPRWCEVDSVTGMPDIPNAATHLAYDPRRNALWTTVQGFFNKECSSSCPSPGNGVVLPQWIVRHNLKPKKPFIDEPSGSVAGQPGSSVSVSAKIYSRVPLQSVIARYYPPGGGSQDINMTVVPVATGLFNVHASVPVPSTGTAQYEIIATSSVLDPSTGTPLRDATARYDVIQVSSIGTAWHFAEGVLHPEFRPFLTLVNPSSAAASVSVTYRPDKTFQPHTQSVDVGANSRYTVNVRDYLLSIGWSDVPDTGFGISVASSQPIIAERPVYFRESVLVGSPGNPSSGAHNAMGTRGLVGTWRFGEGYFSTRPGDNWKLFLVMANPSAANANVTVRLLPEPGNPEPPPMQCVVEAGKRTTLAVTFRLQGVESGAGHQCPTNPWGGALKQQTGFGIEVVSDRPLVVERPIYMAASPGLGQAIRGGDVALGATAARTRWIFAEGFAAHHASRNFATWLTVANPHPTNGVGFDVTLYTRGTAPVSFPSDVGPRGRRTIAVHDIMNSLFNLPAGTAGGADVSIEVRSRGGPLVVERPIYFSRDVGVGGVIGGSHHAVGATVARTEWQFAEGWRAGNVAVYLTLLNPSFRNASVEITYFPEGQGRPPRTVNTTVPAGRRITRATHADLPWPGEYGYGIRVRSTNGVPLVAERPMYFNRDVGSAGFFIQGGHNVLPLHNFGSGTGDVTSMQLQRIEMFGPPKGVPLAITRTTGDITATAGQSLVIEATIQGDADSVRVAYTHGASTTHHAMAFDFQRDIWVGSIVAASERGYFQVIAEAPNTTVTSDPRRVEIVRGAITGRVTGENGQDILSRAPVEGVKITAVGPQGGVSQVFTNAAGYYVAPVPEPGNYTLFIEPTNTPGVTPGWADMYTVHTPSVNDSSPISVPEAGAAYDEVLPKAGRIFGKITALATSQLSFWVNRIAFSSNRDGNDEIYVMASDGSSQTRLTNHPASDIWPSFSPDGEKIVFSSNRDGDLNPEGDYELYVMNADGTSLTRLTYNTSDDWFPAWSPVGSRIAFSRFVGGDGGGLDLYVINTDGSGEVGLTATPGEAEVYPAWSPGAEEIAFTKVTGFFSFSVWKMNSDGSGQAQLLADRARLPSYSPDGTKITFTSLLDGNDEVYVMNRNGSDQVRLTNSAGTDAASRYALDGSKIVFVSNRHNPADPSLDIDVYKMNPDGSDQVRVSTGASLTAPPSLGPGPTALAETTVTFFDRFSNKTIGGTVLTDREGNYEKWLPPGTYYALVNSATTLKPLGWNGYAPIWSKGQLFDQANGGDISFFYIQDPRSSVRYDEELPPVFPVRGRVIPVGGPGLGAGGKAGSYRAISPFGQFWAVDLPQDGRYTYPLPNGQWKIIYIVPGYQNSYYHDTTDFDQADVITVAGAGKTLEDQHIFPR